MDRDAIIRLASAGDRAELRPAGGELVAWRVADCNLLWRMDPAIWPRTSPILFPIAKLLGIDPVHYGIVIIAAMGIAFFLPPVGVGLTIAAGIGRVDIDDVNRSYVPYMIALLVGLALIAAFPVITLVLPRIFLGYKE